MAFNRYEQIISLQNVLDFADVSKGVITTQTQKQFDLKYELLATIWQNIHYNELFSTEDGKIRTDIPSHSFKTLQKSLIHIYFYTDVTIELWDTLKLEGSTDLDGGRTQLNTWDPGNLFDALPLITKQFIEGAGIRDAIATGDFKSLIESDPTEFVSEEQFQILVEQVVKNEQDIKNLTIGNVRTGLIPTESSAESWQNTADATQEQINIENADIIKELKINVETLEDAINNKLLRTSRSIDFESVSVTGATSYILGFTNYTSDYFDSTAIIVNPGTPGQRNEYRTFTLKEGLTLKAGVPIDIPINLDFELTNASNNESGKIRIFVNGVGNIIGDFKIEGTITNTINFYKVFRITPAVDITTLSFYIDAIVVNGGFNAIFKKTSYLEVLVETVIGVPEDIQSKLNDKVDKTVILTGDDAIEYTLKTGRRTKNSIYLESDLGSIEDINGTYVNKGKSILRYNTSTNTAEIIAYFDNRQNGGSQFEPVEVLAQNSLTTRKYVDSKIVKIATKLGLTEKEILEIISLEKEDDKQ